MPMLKDFVDKLQTNSLRPVIHFLILPMLAIYAAVFIPLTISLNIASSNTMVAPNYIPIDSSSPDVSTSANTTPTETTPTSGTTANTTTSTTTTTTPAVTSDATNAKTPEKVGKLSITL